MEIFRALVDAYKLTGKDWYPGRHVLRAAVLEENAGMVDELLRRGASVCPGNNDQTALDIAIMRNNVTILSMLLIAAYDADSSLRDCSGNYRAALQTTLSYPHIPDISRTMLSILKNSNFGRNEGRQRSVEPLKDPE